MLWHCLQHPHAVDDEPSTTDLLSTRPLLPALRVPVRVLVVGRPDAGPRRPPDDVPILLLLLPRSLLSGLLLRFSFFPSNLNTGQVLAVLVPKNIPGSV